MSRENPKVEWCEKSGGNCLRFTFSEKLTAHGADIAIEEWRRAFHQRKDECVTLIWDCKNMKQYESGARKKWTDALNETRRQIGDIWLISDSSIIRMGASVMALATTINIKKVRSEDEMHIV